MATPICLFFFSLPFFWYPDFRILNLSCYCKKILEFLLFLAGNTGKIGELHPTHKWESVQSFLYYIIVASKSKVTLIMRICECGHCYIQSHWSSIGWQGQFVFEMDCRTVHCAVCCEQSALVAEVVCMLQFIVCNIWVAFCLFQFLVFRWLRKKSPERLLHILKVYCNPHRKADRASAPSQCFVNDQ